RRDRRRPLRIGNRIDRAAILRADIVALPHPLGGVVALPERPEQSLVRDLARVVDDQHHLGMAGAARADLLVRRGLRQPPRIADRGRVDAVHLPELALRAPETAEAEERPLGPLGKRPLQGRTEHGVLLRHTHRDLASRQRLGLRRHSQRSHALIVTALPIAAGWPGSGFQLGWYCARMTVTLSTPPLALAASISLFAAASRSPAFFATIACIISSEIIPDRPSEQSRKMSPGCGW